MRLAIKTLDGVRRLLNLLKTGDDAVVNSAALALSTVLQAMRPCAQGANAPGTWSALESPPLTQASRRCAPALHVQ